MAERLDLTGQRFGRLVVLEYDHTENNRAYWRCQCDCGGEKITCTTSLRGGVTRSCGCLHREATKWSNTRHGMCRSRIYKIWRHMRSRCQDPNDISYKYYGARGVTLCERWQDFGNFLADMGPSYEDGLSIERLDNDKDYTPDNCRWIPVADQAKNRSFNRMLTVDGKTRCLAEQARFYGISINTARYRAAHGYSDQEIIFGRQSK